MRKGFTLIELLVFVAIFTLIVSSFIGILVSVINIQTRQVAMNEVEEQGQFVTQQLQYYIQTARLVDMTADSATTTLVLRESTSSINPTIFSFSSGTLYLQQGSGGFQSLTSARVTVSSVSFTRHYNLNSSSSPTGVDSVAYSFTLTAGTAATQSSQTFQSSVTVLDPVNKIALIQQAKTENNSASVSSLVTAFPSNNEGGDLLIAMVADRGNSTSSLLDTSSNTWVAVATTTWGLYSSQFTLYVATSAKAGANTTTLTFSPAAQYAAIYVYEYRGASNVSSFDTWAGQNQLSTSTPSSGLTNPTSSVELLLGMTMNQNTTEVPSVTSGFTLETSSTVNNTTQLFVADRNQYITGQVSSAWNYTGTPNSTTMIATFK